MVLNNKKELTTDTCYDVAEPYYAQLKQTRHKWLYIVLLYFFLLDLYWSIIASQYIVSFCCTTKQISHMHTHVPISPASWASILSSLSHPFKSSQSIELISMCYVVASHQPTILHSVVYICWYYSHFATASPSQPMSSSPFSRSTSLFLPCN